MQIAKRTVANSTGVGVPLRNECWCGAISFLIRFPVFVHLALVLLLGLYIPPYLAAWYRQAAAMIG